MNQEGISTYQTHIFSYQRHFSTLCWSSIRKHPHQYFWVSAHSLLSDLLPLYILLVILTENVKYTSLMAYLFTRDMWHCFPSSIPQHNWLLSLKVHSSITSASQVVQPHQQPNQYFCCFCFSSSEFYSLETSWLWQLLHTEFLIALAKIAQSLLGTGETKNIEFYKSQGTNTSLPQLENSAPHLRGTNTTVQSAHWFTAGNSTQKPCWSALVTTSPVHWEESNPLLLDSL